MTPIEEYKELVEKYIILSDKHRLTQERLIKALDKNSSLLDTNRLLQKQFNREEKIITNKQNMPDEFGIDHDQYLEDNCHMNQY